MSAVNYVTSVPVFHGAQGKYYLCDGFKYHPSFPMAWATDNNLSGRGPIECGNCRAYGSIRGVFVGYCGGCVHTYEQERMWRGVFFGGFDVNQMNNESIWRMYPYMCGVKKSEIGDEPDAEVTNDGCNIESILSISADAIENSIEEPTEEESAEKVITEEQSAEEDYITHIIRLRKEQLPIIREADLEDEKHKLRQLYKRHVYNYYSNMLDKFGPSEKLSRHRDEQLPIIQEADEEDIRHNQEQAAKRFSYNYYTRILRDILQI
jgi:hypothetical protein